MSCITENTMIVRKEDEYAVQRDYEKYKDDHRVNGFKRVYTDNTISIYIFDANGDGPWEIERDTVVPIAIETNYFEFKWTRVNGHDYGWPLKRWLKGKIPEKSYNQIRRRISYSNESV